MEPKPANELLLTTLADRDSRVRTARLKLGRLIALFAGIATVLLLASHHPARASGTSSLRPDGAGLSISIPLGDFPGAAGRPMVRIFALVAGDEQVGSERDRPLSPRRIAFAPIATVGGLAGVTRTALARPPVRQSRADGTRADSVQARRKARLATTSYQRMLRRYLSLPQDTSSTTVIAHAHLVRAYEIARAWRKYAGMR
jgi:hypothetical protein